LGKSGCPEGATKEDYPEPKKQSHIRGGVKKSDVWERQKKAHKTNNEL